MREEIITFRTVGSVLFGNNSLEQIGSIVEEMGAKRILVITDKGIAQCGLIDRLKKCLSRFEYCVYDEVEETPDLRTIRNCTQFAKEGGFDLLVGFGGGSPMDATKAVSVMLTNEGDLDDYAVAYKPVPRPGLRKILVATTAGTGSEVTIYSVLARREVDPPEIVGIFDRHCLAEWAIVDPTLTLTMPPSLTAVTGIDALSHAVDCYVNTKSSFQNMPFALEGIKLISQNLEKATANGSDLEARYKMSAGSLCAGIAFTQTGSGLAHIMVEGFQIRRNVAHGTGIAVALPHAMSYNLESVPQLYAEMARAMGLDEGGLSEMVLAKKAVERVKEIISQTGLPQRLSEFGIGEKDVETMAKSAMTTSAGLAKKNPRPLGERDLVELFRNAL